jgi:hypothetical protein
MKKFRGIQIERSSSRMTVKPEVMNAGSSATLRACGLQGRSAARRKCWRILGGFSFERKTTVSTSIRAEQQIEFSPYTHHLEEFLSFLKQERGFADATIVNRKRSLKPFLAWLVRRGAPLSTVSPVVITKYFTGAVAGKWKRTSVSFHVQSLRSFFRYASSRGWCTAGISESIDAPPTGARR